MNACLIPNLKNLQTNNLHFNNHSAVVGTEWTAGAMTAFLFGLPLKLPSELTIEYGELAYFLPGVPSVLELLAENHYSVNLIMGIDGDYGAINNIFRTHAPEANIYDKNYFSQIFSLAPYQDLWGFPDNLVYRQAKIILQTLAQSDQPFFVTIMTIDTHVPAKSFGDYPAIYNDERDAFVAADYMAADFVNWLQQQDFYKDTVVIITGDHKYMSNNLGAVALTGNRSIYNAYLNTAKLPARNPLKRAFTAMDLAPTLLESIGVQLPQEKFGLGVSLYADSETLLERDGRRLLDDELGRPSTLYNSFYTNMNPAVNPQAAASKNSSPDSASP
jgi:phosphoglycerol transferase